MNDDNLYQIQSPDATEYWIKMIKCQDACPVHTDACGYVTAIAAGVGTIMPSYSSWNGIKLHGHSYLLNDVLKAELGFEGFVVSDWESIGELTVHGVASDLRQAAAMAIAAGSDMDMQADAYLGHLADLVRDGTIRYLRFPLTIRV